MTHFKKLIVFAFVGVILAFAGTTETAKAETAGSVEPILHIENETITDDNFINLEHEVDQLKDLDEGTIVARFRSDGSSIMSLFSLSNNHVSDGHFHFYISSSGIGSENRYEAPGEPKEN